MCKVQPLGAILPLAVGLSISDLPTATWKSVELSPEMTGKIQIRNNEIVVSCELKKWAKDDHLMPVYMRALDNCSGNC
jgi:hypothetical protein